MAKDGTSRGGPRTGSGRKPRPLEDMVLEGRVKASKEKNIRIHADGAPPVHAFMKRAQKDGSEFLAEQIFMETWGWLSERGCADLVNSQLVEHYAVSAARWIQCEEKVSENGFIASHPTTGAAIASPYVAMGREYMKQMNQTWYQIQSVVKEHAQTHLGMPDLKDSMMESLLSAG